MQNLFIVEHFCDKITSLTQCNAPIMNWKISQTSRVQFWELTRCLLSCLTHVKQNRRERELKKKKPENHQKIFKSSESFWKEPSPLLREYWASNWVSWSVDLSYLPSKLQSCNKFMVGLTSGRCAYRVVQTFQATCTHENIFTFPRSNPWLVLLECGL